MNNDKNKAKEELISVVVPIYNTERYLDKCIDSLVNQTYKNIEIILIDDGSTDRSGCICDEWKRKDSRIIVAHTENKGVSEARNKGISISRGNWISFVDGDDYAKETMLEFLMMNAYDDSNAVDIVISDYYIDCNQREYEKHYFNRSRVFIDSKEKEEILINVITTSICAPWGRIYSKSLIVDNDLKFVPGLHRSQDSIFNLHAFYHAKRISYVRVPLYYYVIRDDSVSHRFFSNYFDYSDTMICELQRFGSQRMDDDVWKKCIDVKRVIIYVEYCRLVVCHQHNKASFFRRIEDIKTGANRILGEHLNLSTFYMDKKRKVMYYLVKLNLWVVIYFAIKLWNRFIRKY